MLITQHETRGREFIAQIFEKSGEIRVRDSCTRKRVEYRCSGYGCAWIINQTMGVHSPTYNLLFSSILFLLLFATLSYKTPIMYCEERRQSDFGVSILVTVWGTNFDPES